MNCVKRFLVIMTIAAFGAIAYADEAAAVTPEVAATAETQAPAVEEREKRGIDFGGRLALGNAYTVGADIRLPMSESWRFNIGFDGGYAFGKNGYNSWLTQFNFFVEQKNNISKEGDFRWFWGPGISLGYYGVWGTEKGFDERTVLDSLNRPNQIWNSADTANGFPRLHDRNISDNSSNIGLGVQFGLETILSFIDPEHSLYRMRDATVAVDFRLMYYPWDGDGDSLDMFRDFVWGIGLSFRWTY